MHTIIFGNSQLADIAFFYLKNDSYYEPKAFCVDSQYIDKDTNNGLPVFSTDEIYQKCPPQKYNFIIPVIDNKLRQNKFKFFKNKGYNFISYKSSKSIINSPIGDNCLILEQNNIQPFVNFGSNIILWSGNHIGHHSTIKDNVFISSHVVVSGNCVVESYCYLGINSCIKDNTTLSEGTFVCMSSAITKNTKPYKKYFGCPAKEISDWNG